MKSIKETHMLCTANRANLRARDRDSARVLYVTDDRIGNRLRDLEKWKAPG
jgi:hypothetical protein